MTIRYANINSVKKEIHKEGDEEVASILNQCAEEADVEVDNYIYQYVTVPISAPIPGIITIAANKWTISKFYASIRNKGLEEAYEAKAKAELDKYVDGLKEAGLTTKPSATFGMSDGLSGNSGNLYHWK